nr:LOB domain-containing protein 16-like [Ipomoea trifida]
MKIENIKGTLKKKSKSARKLPENCPLVAWSKSTVSIAPFPAGDRNATNPSTVDGGFWAPEMEGVPFPAEESSMRRASPSEKLNDTKRQNDFLYHQETGQYATLWPAAQIEMDRIHHSSSRQPSQETGEDTKEIKLLNQCRGHKEHQLQAVACAGVGLKPAANSKDCNEVRFQRKIIAVVEIVGE